MTSKEPKKYTQFAQVLARLAKGLDESKIPYMVFGGQAVLLHGQPRFTQDIDITLGIDPTQARTALALVKKLKLKILVNDPISFLRKTFVLPVAEPRSGIRVDFVFSLSPLEQEAIERAITIELAGQKVRFITVEDLIVFKIVAGRARDLDDVRSIIAKNPRFSRADVVFWLEAFDRELAEGCMESFREIERDLKRLRRRRK